MARDQDLISLNSEASEDDQSIQSMQDWDYDDQVLDLDEKTLESLRYATKEGSDQEEQEEEDDDEEWGSRKDAFYDADQDSGKYSS